MDFHKINYVWQIYPLSRNNKIQIAAILLFHHSNTIGQFVKKKYWVALVGVVALWYQMQEIWFSTQTNWYWL